MEKLEILIKELKKAENFRFVNSIMRRIALRERKMVVNGVASEIIDDALVEDLVFV